MSGLCDLMWVIDPEDIVKTNSSCKKTVIYIFKMNIYQTFFKTQIYNKESTRLAFIFQIILPGYMGEVVGGLMCYDNSLIVNNYKT